MGKFDSTRTRVTPVFDHLRTSGDSWLEHLLTLSSGGHSNPLPWAGRSMRVDELCYGPEEKALPASIGLLDWLIGNARDVTGKGLMGLSEHSARMRLLLLERDLDAMAEARSLLAASRSDKRWYVLEGPSYPDVYIATPDLIVVIEGKRTESGPTTSTMWMSPRLQMLRHMDSALEASDGRTVLGFFAVEGPLDGSVPTDWQQHSKDTFSPKALASSLPHRTDAERQTIARGFLGITTWQAICREFGIDQKSLPDTT